MRKLLRVFHKKKKKTLFQTIKKREEILNFYVKENLTVEHVLLLLSCSTKKRIQYLVLV